MQYLFVINGEGQEDLGLYEQVFQEAGFRLVSEGGEDELLLSAGALMYADERSAGDQGCEELIAFCLRREIPLLIIHESGRYGELLENAGVYDAAVLSMPEWKEILNPKKEPEPATEKPQSRLLNALVILLCLIPAVLFGYRVWHTVMPADSSSEVQTENGSRMLDACGSSTVQVYSISSFGDTVYRGSGYAVTSDGYILTCAHIIDHPSSMYRIVCNLQILPAELVARDEEKDLALMKINTLTQPLPLASSQPIGGEAVYLIGWPENSDRELLAGTYIGTSVSDGQHVFRVISLPMYQGLSGSCVLNSRGEVIGTAAAMDSLDHNIGLIVSFEDVRDFLKDHVFVNAES